MNQTLDSPLDILVLTPTGNDALNAMVILRDAGLQPLYCANLTEVCEHLGENTGALLIAEEAFTAAETGLLMKILAQQEAWSDIPIVLITAGEHITHIALENLQIVGSAGNVTLLERPLRPSTLVSSLRVALRSRRRQHQIRDLLEQQRKFREELEKRVEERTARLTETIAELEAFSYSVSHDLRTPLRAMQGYSEFLWEDYSAQLDDTGKEYLHRILQASGRLDRLVQDILAYSRLSRGEWEIKDIRLQMLLKDVIESYPMLQPSSIDIESELPLLSVRGHEGSLTQVFSNLLTNALKFVPEGRKPRVKIRTEPFDGKVRLWFEDNGIGIAPAYWERIFKIFEKAPGEKEYDGTGIGLAIVRKAVERMGGRVGVKSAVGEGCKFWIELPEAHEQ
jgi:signal transduction histidine kinase